MCGICGFSGFEDPALLREMMNLLRHRGPDDQGMWSDGTVSLGHTRLSIIDLSSRGQQPLSNEDGSVWVTFNGEIYNHRDLRRELSNHTFSSDTDTEILVHAYEEFGPQFVNQLRGMFAFSLYDMKTQIMHLVRDPIGKKPLYYIHDGPRLLFSSEIKALLPVMSKIEMEVAIDSESLCRYLVNQYVPGTATLIKGIRRLPPGSRMNFSCKDGQSDISQYWTLQEIPDSGDWDHQARCIRDLLEESTRLRMIADVPIGAFLSGGIDSSAIVSMARPLVDYDFHTFTASFEPYVSEAALATEVAETFGTVHHQVRITESDVIAEFDRITWHFDEPLGDAAIIANYFLSGEAQRYVKVVLAGEGADELFAGYNSYRAGIRCARWFEGPVSVRRALDRTLSALPFAGNPYVNNKVIYLHYLGQSSLEAAQQYSWQITGVHPDEQRWLGLNRCIDSSMALNTSGTFTTPLNRMLGHDCLNHLPDLYLMKADKATMAHSVEERVPILDQRLIEYAFACNPAYKIRNGVEKAIWRRAVHDLLPSSVLSRKKQGFSVPYTQWMRGEMREHVVQTLSDSPFITSLFNPRRIESLLGNYSAARSSRPALIVWNLFALARWVDAFDLSTIA